MLKEAVASKAAKLLMTCVCPVAGTTALSLGVPQVREAVHKAVQPRQYAKPKTRVRQPEAPMELAAAVNPCPTVTPFALSDIPPSASDLALNNGPVELAEVPAPEAGVPLTSRIFIPPSGFTLRSDDRPTPGPLSAPEPSVWVQLMLGFGLIGVPRRAAARKDGKPS